MEEELRQLDLKIQELNETKQVLYQQNQMQSKRNKDVLAKVKAKNENLHQQIEEKTEETDISMDLSQLERELSLNKRKLEDSKLRSDKKR